MRMGLWALLGKKCHLIICAVSTELFSPKKVLVFSHTILLLFLLVILAPLCCKSYIAKCVMTFEVKSTYF